MNINDNEKIAYLVKQLYDYWKKQKINEFIIDNSIVLPKLSDEEAEKVLTELTSKTFSISFEYVFDMGFNEHGEPEEQEVIPGRFRIKLKKDFADFALEYHDNSVKPNILFDKNNNMLIVNDIFKIKFGSNNKNTSILRVLFSQPNIAKKWNLVDMFDKIHKSTPDRMGDTTEKGFFSILQGINHRVGLNTDGCVSKLLNISDFDCQLNPIYTYLNW